MPQGRQPRDTRYTGAPADIESPPRLIEVKSFGTSNRGDDLLMEVRQVEEARRNPDYYVYVVENVGPGDSAKFTLRVLSGTRLQASLLVRSACDIEQLTTVANGESRSATRSDAAGKSLHFRSSGPYWN